MKSFRFVNIWLLSHRDKKARFLNFNPGGNLLRGRNHTGKTSLIRSLFETLGAIPQGKLEGWDADTASLLEFSVDNTHYFALRQSNRRALFNADKTLIMSTSTLGEWSRAFSSITGFNLVFSNKDESDIRPADPACFFLPFYVNQDGSWQSEWNTFKGLKRFKAPIAPILEYFTGVCPPEYYQARAEKAQQSNALDELKRELKLLERTAERLARTLPASGPKLNPDNFEKEIALLTGEVTELNRKQESLRRDLVREQELLHSVEEQIRLTVSTLTAHDRDAKYLHEDAGPLICPTCNAEHSKSFLDVLTFTEDARVLRELTGQLSIDATAIKQRCYTKRSELGELESSYKIISNLLESKKGDLKLQDVVESMSAEKAFEVFDEERNKLRKAIDEAAGAVEILAEKMKAYRDKKKTQAILTKFRAHYDSGRAALKLPPTESSKMTLVGRPDLSGSGGPRSILAYYSAIWKTCHEENGTYDIPVIIDSPNQQAQDDINLPAVMDFIAKKLPDTQLILGLESPMNSAFDQNVQLDVPYSMLLSDEWAGVETVLEPLLAKMYEVSP